MLSATTVVAAAVVKDSRISPIHEPQEPIQHKSSNIKGNKAYGRRHQPHYTSLAQMTKLPIYRLNRHWVTLHSALSHYSGSGSKGQRQSEKSNT